MDGGTDVAVASNGVVGDDAAADDSSGSEDGGKPESIEATNGLPPTSGNGPTKQRLLFCERFVEFLIDLMSQAPTRRYTHTLLEDKAVLIKCRMCPLFQHEQGTRLRHSFPELPKVLISTQKIVQASEYRVFSSPAH